MAKTVNGFEHIITIENVAGEHDVAINVDRSGNIGVESGCTVGRKDLKAEVDNRYNPKTFGKYIKDEWDSKKDYEDAFRESAMNYEDCLKAFALLDAIERIYGKAKKKTAKKR